MALTPEIRTSQATTRVVATADSPEVFVAQASLRTIYNFPSEAVNTFEASVRGVTVNTPDVRLYQTLLRAVIRGRTDDPSVRAWTFTLDGHDFYVLRLGNIETLIYDLHSDQWYVWGSEDSRLWRAYTGTNWLGGNFLAPNYGSNVVVGDDGNGSLYFLDTARDLDSDPIQGNENLREYRREISFQVPTKRYASVRCFGVEVLGSIGQFDADDLLSTTVGLTYSDDRGITYQDAGEITVAPEDYSARLYWGSLGSINAPGRIFKLTDYGALKRMDSAVMIADGEGST